MVLEVSVQLPSLFVYAMILLVLSEDALLIPGRRPFWDGFHYYRVGREDVGVGHDTRILLRRKETPEVYVLPTSMGSLYRCHVCRQELAELLDGCTVYICLSND